VPPGIRTCRPDRSGARVALGMSSLLGSYGWPAIRHCHPYVAIINVGIANVDNPNIAEIVVVPNG
jgi:hypothetical protein